MADPTVTAPTGTSNSASSGAMSDEELLKLLQSLSQTTNGEVAQMNAGSSQYGMPAVGNPALMGTITPEEQQLQQKLNMEGNIAGGVGLGGTLLGGLAGGLIGGIPTGGAGAIPGIGIGSSIGGLLGGVGGKFLQDMISSGDKQRLQQIQQKRQQDALKTMEDKQKDLISAQNRQGLLQAFLGKYL